MKLAKTEVMGYKIQTEAPHICLECGDEILYGRTDKVYCSDSCRRKHNNRIHNSRKSVRLKVLGQLDRNYEILERLLAAGIESIDIDKLEDMGYNMKYATSYRKIRGRSEYRCFDIRYQCTPSRIMKLGRVSAELMLQPSEDS